MSNIPAARQRLDNIIDYIKCEGRNIELDQVILELKAIEALLYRKPPVRKANPQSQPMTPELAASIRAFAKRNQQMTFQAIGQRFNVNAGRVTEALQSADGDIP